MRQGVEEELKKANKKILTLNDEVTQLNSQLELTKKAVAEIETNLKQVTVRNFFHKKSLAPKKLQLRSEISAPASECCARCLSAIRRGFPY